MASTAIGGLDWLCGNGSESDEARSLRGLFTPGEEGSLSYSELDRLRAFETLEQAFLEASSDNWDGEGSEPADPMSYRYALLFTRSLPGWVPNPEASVDPDGEICLEWDQGRRSIFSVSIGRDGTLTYAGLFGVSKQHGVESFADDIPPEILSGIRRASFNPPR
jgi:hypothetical protein